MNNNKLSIMLKQISGYGNIWHFTYMLGAATRKTNNYKSNIGLLTIPQPQTATQSNNIATQTMRELAGTSLVRSLAGWLVD